MEKHHSCVASYYYVSPAPHIAPPDVPPRNPTMSRMNGRVQGIANDLDMDFEPSCLVRTPSGNVYIPSSNLSKFYLITIQQV
ncbi:CLUMA_CG021130, isoform A [Clunio marinus]|uniref:CLUMA_CG021130, isoform A n=1 Tax=Clunio marinus TaxID=568069 RepID=A0A1J1JAY4_9DIPT|nr:CLUMA_CG021130, isoform A [Clunio marinus]